MAVFDIRGILHKSMEAWKMKRKIARSSFAQCFSTLLHAPSGPQIFLALIALNTLKKVSSEMSMLLSSAEQERLISFTTLEKSCL